MPNNVQSVPRRVPRRRVTTAHRLLQNPPAWARGLPALPILFRGEWAGILVTSPEACRVVRSIAEESWNANRGILLFQQGEVSPTGTWRCAMEEVRLRVPERQDTLELLPGSFRTLRQWSDWLMRGGEANPEWYQDYGVRAIENLWVLLQTGTLPREQSMGTLYRSRGDSRGRPGPVEAQAQMLSSIQERFYEALGYTPQTAPRTDTTGESE